MITTVKNRISPSDQVFASIENNGRVLATMNKSNFSSTEDVMRLIMSMAGKWMGVAKISIRNKSQGWTENRAIALSYC
ncbi:MAG: hypothetical protein IJ626_02605 [Muribaculaceae bacterium]|nr:hypothetical protein [Muribaculaceae bacterium]